MLAGQVQINIGETLKGRGKQSYVLAQDLPSAAGFGHRAWDQQ